MNNLIINNYKKINEGAEAVIYSTHFLGIKVVVKYRLAKTYREKLLDELLRYQRTKREAKILSVASSIINAPKVLFLEKDRIFIQKLEGKNLSLLLKQNNNKNNKSKNNIKNKKIYHLNERKIFNEIGSSLAYLHNNNIIHGDFTPANILVNNVTISIIDFGLGEISSMIEDKAVDLLLMKRAVSPKQYFIFLESYKKSANNSIEIISRLDKIEKRARYQKRTIANL